MIKFKGCTGETEKFAKSGRGNRLRILVLTMVMSAFLVGCGKDNTKVAEGMQLIQSLDYQGALTAFDEAEELDENANLSRPYQQTLFHPK